MIGLTAARALPTFSSNTPPASHILTALIFLIILIKHSYLPNSHTAHHSPPTSHSHTHQPLKPDFASSKDPADVGNYHLRAPS